MAILDYSRTLNAAGQQTPLQSMIETRKGLQGLKAGDMAMKQQQQQQEAQQAEMQRIQAARVQGAELLKGGTPEQIADFGIMNPNVMKDLIAASGFADKQAVNSRLNYAKNVLSGSVSPRDAINARIQEIEFRGGNADQLRVTAQGTDEQIINAAEKDLAVISPKMFESYRKAVGGGDIKTETIQTPAGAIVINKQTGETVKEIGIPEKRAEFEANKKERSRKIAEQKRKELAQIETAKIKKLDAADARADALDTTKRAFALTKELGNKDVISPVTGWYDRMTPTGNKSQDVINKALELKDLLTLNNLGLMSGVLTDRDIQILARAGSGLNVDDDGFLGSETGVVNQIKKVEFMLDQKLKKAVERGDLSQLDYESMKDGSPVSQQAEGKIMIDANGNRAMVYPDGSYKGL
tara:strand:- start:2007 stop:3236 length:1230 start_codon:yes stop_codon:yes gene_type:complete